MLLYYYSNITIIFILNINFICYVLDTTLSAEERRQALERSQLEGLADRDRRADQVRAKKVSLRDVTTIENNVN